MYAAVKIFNIKGTKILSKKLIGLLLAFAVAVGSVSGLSVGAVAAQAATTPDDLGTMRAKILNDTNAYRAAAGQPPLQMSSGLNTTAQNWSISQADNKLMAHDPNYVSKLPGSYYNTGENVGAGSYYTDITAAWYSSPGHRANLLGLYNEIGIGVAYDDDGNPYYTQYFGNNPSVQTVPGAPRDVTASPGGSGAANVSFTAHPNTGNSTVTGYVITATPTNGGSPVNFNVASAGSHTITGLPGGVTYNITVKAINGVGQSPSSASVQVLVVGVPSVQVSSIDATPYDVVITWNAQENGSAITGYRLVFEGGAPINLPASENVQYFDELKPGTNYSGSIVAINGIGESAEVPFSFATPAIAPDAPPAPNVSVVDKTNLNINWTKPSYDGGAAISSYELVVTQADTEPVVIPVDANTFTYKFENAVRGKDYTVGVRAINSAGSSETSDVVIEVPYTAPDAVTGLTATLSDERTITANWEVPADNGGYDNLHYIVIVNRIDENGQLSEFAVENTTDTTFVFSNLDASTNYVVSVEATNTYHTSAKTFSNIVVVPAEPTVSSPVENLVFSNVTGSTVDLDWDVPANNGGTAITGYSIEVENKTTGDVETFNTAANVTSYKLDSLERYTSYDVRVSAINAKGTSSPFLASFNTLADAPSEPLVVDVAFISNTASPFAPVWTIGNPTDDGGDNEINFNITVTTEKGTEIFDVPMDKESPVTTAENPSAISILESGEIFNVTVKAVNSGGESSTIESAFIAPVGASAVTGIVPNFNEDKSRTTFSWNVPEDAGTFGQVTGYQVKISENNSENVYFENVVTETTATLNTPYGKVLKVEITPLTHDTVSFPGVKAEIVTESMPIVPPGQVQNVVLNSSSPGSLTVTWEQPLYDGGHALDDSATVEILDNSDSENPVVIKNVTVDPNQGIQEFTGIRGGTETIARVQVSNPAGNSGYAYSNSATVGATAPEAPEKVSVELDENVDTTVHATLEAGHNGGSTITGYEFILKGTNFSQSIVTTENEATWENVPRGKNYVVEAKVVNAIGKSNETISNEITVPAIAPSKPTATITNLTSRSVVISGEVKDNGGAEITNLQYSYENGIWVEAEIFDPASGKFEINVSNLQGLEDYDFKIRAINNIGASEISTLNFSVPSKAPEGIDIYSVIVDGRNLYVEWQTLGDLNEKETQKLIYRIKVYNDKSEETLSLTTVHPSTWFAGLTPGFNGYVEVSVSVDNGETFILNTESAPFSIAPEAPEAPTSITQIVNNSVTTGFTWTEPKFDGGSAITGYNFILKQDDAIIQNVNTTTNQITGLNLSKGKTYDVEVRAVNAVGAGQATTQTFVTGTTPPSVVLNVTSTATENGVVFKWSAPEDNGGVDITGYEYVLRNTVTNEIVSSDTVNAATFESNEIAMPFGNVNYKFEIAARNSNGLSDKVTLDYRSPILAPKDAPTVTSATFNADNTALTVAWTPGENDGGETISYILNISDGEETEAISIDAENGKYSTIITSDNFEFSNNHKYVITIQSQNSKGISPESPETEIKSNILVPTAATFTNSINENILTITPNSSVNDGGEEPVYTLLVEGEAPVSVTPGVAVNYVVNYGKTYNVTLTTTNSAGETKTEKSIKIPATYPGVPSGNVTVDNVTNDVKITAIAPAFDGGAVITSYIFDIVEDNNVVNTIVSETPEVTIKGSDLKANQSYKVAIRVENSAGLESAESTLGFSTNIIAPGSPTNLDVKVVDANNIKIKTTAPLTDGGDSTNLSVTAEVYDASTNKLVNSFNKKVTVGEETNFDVTDLSHATRYYVSVFAGNSIATSAKVNSDIVKTDGIAPQVATDVNAEITGESSAVVSWKAPVDNGGSEITAYRVVAYSVTNGVFATEKTTATSFEFKGLARGETFEFSVVAINAFGESDEVKAEGKAITAPKDMIIPLPEKLFEQTKDTVEVLEATITGKTLTVTLEDATEFEWFAGFAYSEPLALGWDFVKDGKLTYNIANVPAGNHTFALYNTDGVLVGTFEFVVQANNSGNGGTDSNSGNTGNGSGVTNSVTNRNDDVAVKRTDGNDVTLPITLSIAGLMLLLGGVFVLNRRRKETT